MPLEITESLQTALDALEPLAALRHREGNLYMDQVAYLSIAISLKRIADAIDGRKDRMGIADAVANLVRANP